MYDNDAMEFSTCCPKWSQGIPTTDFSFCFVE